MLLPDLTQNIRNKISLLFSGLHEAAKFMEQESVVCQRQHLRHFHMVMGSWSFQWE